MKTLFKSAFAAFAALFLALSLAGCGDGESKISGVMNLSQKEGVPDSDGLTTFRFKKGTKVIGVNYSSSSDARKHFPPLKEEIANLGITIVEVQSTGPEMAIIIKPLEKDVVGKVHTTGVVLLQPWMLSGGPGFTWVPIQGFV